MVSIIDNKKNKLIEKLKILKDYKAEKLRFATGFLFLNGWEEIKETIPEKIKELKLLFGFTDTEMAMLLSEYFNKEDAKLLISKLAKKLDDKTIDELLNKNGKFKRLIKEGKLKIKWANKLHAKLYLYTKNESKKENIDGRAIVGSSNITSRGLTKEGELNIWLSENETVWELLDWFDDLWKKSKELDPQILLNAIVNEKSKRRVINEFIDLEKEKLSLVEGYLFLLWLLLDGVYDTKEITKKVITSSGKIPIKKHNEEAVLWGYQIINKYGGVILADPVGTGKSFQALGLISMLLPTLRSINKKTDTKILFITPPHLINDSNNSKGQWEEYISNFFDFERVGSLPNISTSKILKCKDNTGQKFEITLVSSYGLSLLIKNETCKRKLSEYDLIVIDEAHHFKNIESNKRKVLNDIIKYHREKYNRNPLTILLTATPIINDIAEILSLMSIYTQGDTGDFDVLARLELEKNIIRKFEKYHEINNTLSNNELKKDEREKLEKEKRALLDDIRTFLKGAIIMRSRAYIEKKFKKSSGSRPKLKNLEYQFKEEKELINLINQLNLSYLEFSPSNILFIKRMNIKQGASKISTENEMVTLQGMVKIMLAKRLESSVKAFLKTTIRIRDEMKYTLKLLEGNLSAEEIAKRLYLMKIGKVEMDEDESKLDLTELNIYELDETEQEIYKRKLEKVKEIFHDSKKLNEIIKGIKEDLKMIERIIPNENLDNIASKFKSKDKMILKFIKEKMKKNKKVVIYSMYVDTIEWLEKLLDENGIEKDRIFKVTGKTKGKVGVIDDFEDLSGPGVMLSTDALSEGVNLTFVDELVNYDIPWTPSTLMQRVGRLWRSGRTKEILFYTILPPKELIDSFSTLIEKVEEKLGKIRDILIQEIRLLKENEELTENFESRVYGGIYSKDNEFRKFMDELSEGEPQALEMKIIDFINNEMFDGLLLKDRITKNEKKFKKIKEAINKGKILNISTEKEKIILITFGKRYWLKIPTKIIPEEKVWDTVLIKKWDLIKQNPSQVISWMIKDKEIDKENIVTAFKSYFKKDILENENLRKSSDLDWRIMNTLVQSTLDDEEINELKEEIFFILAYYFYNRRRSNIRRQALNVLKELGFINNNGKINMALFKDKSKLIKLKEKLQGESENVHVEVIL